SRSGEKRADQSFSILPVRPPRRPTLFPYPTLFRSHHGPDEHDLAPPPTTSAGGLLDAATANKPAGGESLTQVRDEAPADLLAVRSEEHTSELQSRGHLVCRLLLEKKKQKTRPDEDK